MTPAEHLSAAATRLRELANVDAGYIVAMSPPVALALADWLEDIVTFHERAGSLCLGHDEPTGWPCQELEQALPLAALIVPEAAEVES